MYTQGNNKKLSQKSKNQNKGHYIRQNTTVHKLIAS